MNRFRSLAMTEPRGMKIMRRIERRLRRTQTGERRHILEGYNLNTPRVGDILLHIATPIGRQSVRFTSSGEMRWFTPVVFTHELFNIAAE